MSLFVLRRKEMLAFVADGGVGPDDGLLHLRALVLGDEGRSDGETGNAVVVWQVEAELLGVVVDLLNALELQADETLIAAGKGLGGRGGRASGLGDRLLLVLGEWCALWCASAHVHVVVSTSTGGSGDTTEQHGI